MKTKEQQFKQLIRNLRRAKNEDGYCDNCGKQLDTDRLPTRIIETNQAFCEYCAGLYRIKKRLREVDKALL